MNIKRRLLAAAAVIAVAAAVFAWSGPAILTGVSAGAVSINAWLGGQSGQAAGSGGTANGGTANPMNNGNLPNGSPVFGPGNSSGFGHGGMGGYGPGTTGPGQGNAGSTDPASSTAASDAQSAGLVLINTTVDFGSAQAAGTGMVIDPDGIVITNHHVVAGSTTVSVTVPSTGQSYPAEVLGYDSTADVAVLQVSGVSGWSTVTTSTAPVSVGDDVTAVGNAEGGGQLIASAGQITETSDNITVTEDDGSQAALSDLIATNAALVPGDSGGALYDSSGDVVGMNVAGSSDARVSEGYDIPISTVLSVAKDILAGTVTDTISYSHTAALGVEVSGQSQQALIVGVISGGPADKAGVTPGSTLTAIDGNAVTSVSDLTQQLANHKPGDQVKIAWTDQSGTDHTATVVLTEGPLA